jgi:hypothetical protein
LSLFPLKDKSLAGIISKLVPSMPKCSCPRNPTIASLSLYLDELRYPGNDVRNGAYLKAGSSFKTQEEAQSREGTAISLRPASATRITRGAIRHFRFVKDLLE